MKKTMLLAAILSTTACSNITEQPYHSELVFQVVDNCTLIYKDEVLNEVCESSLKLDY